MSVNVCRCCMARPPDKDLKAQYSKRGKTVVYGDMLKECFEIQILKEGDNGGICDLCEMKLVDANEFKQQVQKCQKLLQKIAAAPVKIESKPKIKQEVEEDNDNEDEDEANDIYFLDVKEESDVEMRDEASADDDKNLAELFPDSVKREKKKPAAAGGKKKIDKNVTGETSSGLNKTQPAKHVVTYSNFEIKMNIDNIMKHSNATPFLTKTSAGIVCSFCVKTFKDIKYLAVHINDDHKDEMVTNVRKVDADRLCFKVDITDLKCTMCDKDFKVISSLKAHLIKDHNVKFHPHVNDYFCEFKLTSGKIDSCGLCDEKYSSFDMLAQHMNSHYRNYTCKVCKVGFINAESLKTHEKRKCLAKPDNKTKMINKTPEKSLKLIAVSKSRRNKVKHNVENILKYSNCTPFVNHTVAGIACAFCDSCLGNKQELKAHVIGVHYKEDNYIDKFKRAGDLYSFVVKVDITDLACNICYSNVAYISDLKEHLIKEHAIVFYTDVKVFFAEFKLTSNEIFTCVFCDCSFETFKALRQHLSKHYNNFVCEVCGASFLTKNSQRLHTNNVHGTGSYKCSTCCKVFSNNPAKLMHERVVHQKEARFKTKCPFCDAKFTDYGPRNQHLFEVHNTKAAAYNCNSCDKTFLLKKHLTQHIKRVHLMEKNHVCSYCGNRFFAPAALKNHLITHEREKAKTHQCVICSKAFSRRKTLIAHMVVHSDDKKFKCDLCNSEFRHKVSLKNHMLSKHSKVEHPSVDAD